MSNVRTRPTQLAPGRTAGPTRRPLGRGHRALLAFALSGSLAGGLAAAPQPAGAVPPGGVKNQANGARVSIGASTVKAGSRIRVSGTGWKSKGSRVGRGAQVTVKLDDGVIVGVFPIRSKRFSGYVTIPRQVKAGRHWLRFLAAKPATSIKSRTFRVTK